MKKLIQHKKEYLADFPDVIAPLSGAATGLVYNGGSGGTAAIQYEDLSRRLVVMGFPFEVIQPDQRSAVMNAALEFLGTRATDTVIDHPADGGYYSTAPAFDGWAVGEALTRVDVQILDINKSLYWDGIGWGGETWVTATGIYNWSYSLSHLTDGTYALAARAFGEIDDDTPDEVTFMLDTTPPYTTTAVYPADNITQTSPVVVFQWEGPLGDASPLHYRLEIDGEVVIIDGLTVAKVLQNGTHTWRIAATDAAGNDGPWNSPRLFTIDAETSFLPLVMKTILE